MNVGNISSGLSLNKDYLAIWLFPIGIEILIMNGIIVSITLASIEFNFSIKKNITLFRD